MTIDKSAANTAALIALNANKETAGTITVRQNKDLNNLLEQDHLNIKRRTRPMLGFRSFRHAQAILAGIEAVGLVCKEEYEHPDGYSLSQAEQFYPVAA